jgi:hypothetical protein
MICPGHLRPQEVRLDGVSGAATANSTAQVAAQFQVFALKQATSAAATAALTLLQSLAPPASAPNPPHLGQNVDASA